MRERPDRLRARDSLPSSCHLSSRRPRGVPASPPQAAGGEANRRAPHTYQGFNLQRLERSFAFARLLLLLPSRPTAQEEGEEEADMEPKQHSERRRRRLGGKERTSNYPPGLIPQGKGASRRRPLLPASPPQREERASGALLAAGARGETRALRPSSVQEVVRCSDRPIYSTCKS